MNKALLQPEVQNFIQHFEEDISLLAFKGSPFPDVTTRELLQQIEGYRKTQKKLPSWHQSESILYPPKLNLEQTSSEETAQYKASLVKGKIMADLTGGMGVDSYYFSKIFQKVVHFEWDEELSKLASHNFKVLGATNIECIAGNGLALLGKQFYDLLYIDPARRHETKGKVFFLNDCEPNVVENLELLLQHCDILMIKSSPMLDLTEGLRALQYVFEIHVVAVANEVKELLWLLSKDKKPAVTVKTVNYQHESIQRFDFLSRGDTPVVYSHPLTYLYEPNAAILKAGAFNEPCSALKVQKLAPHSHLYTSENLVDFPGRVFKIQQVIPYNKSGMRSLHKVKAHITTRNFLESVADLRRKWKIQDGGDRYLFFTTLEQGEKVVLDATKI
jgi:PG_1098 ferredoxin-like domain/THUMP domain-like